jgi:hypothetical protein
MAVKDEHPERHGWWLNELESLVLDQTLYQEYKSNYMD